MVDYASLKVVDLKDLVSKRGLQKPDLRLKQHFVDVLCADDARSPGQSSSSAQQDRDSLQSSDLVNERIRSPLQTRDANVHMNPHDSSTKCKRVEINLTASDSETDVDAAGPISKSQRLKGDVGSVPTSSTQSAGAHPKHEARNRTDASRFSLASSSSTNLHGTHEREAWLADDGGFDEIVGSSQDDALGSDDMHLYGDLSTKIVGCQYYRGYSNPGEHILMRREPGNPYDSNAIRIDNIAGAQIGHIPRRVAEKLAKYSKFDGLKQLRYHSHRMSCAPRPLQWTTDRCAWKVSLLARLVRRIKFIDIQDSS